MADNDSQKKTTKYERKLERRKEEAARQKRRRRTTAGICAVVVAVCAGVLGYQAYDKYQQTHGALLKVGSHEIGREEFDYYYNTSINNFYSQYSSYASYFGVDFSAPLDQQSYSDTMTWKDYFEQQAVTQIRQVYGLTDEAAEKGFTYDASGDVDEFVKSISDAAESADASLDDYVVTLFGENAKLEDIKGYVEQSNTASAYYETIEDGTEVAEDEIQSYYDEHKADYDSVDYKVCKIEADMPEEETEAETESAETEAASETETLSEEEQAEIEAAEAEAAAAKEAAEQAAMEEAKKQADEMLGQVKDEAAFDAVYAKYATDSSELPEQTQMTKSSVYPTEVADWLFDDARAAGDVDVIEDATNNAYYVVLFKNRYLVHEDTVDVRHILITPEEVAEETEVETEAAETAAEGETEAAETEDAEAAEAARAEAEAKAKEDAKAEAERIYEEWKGGEATEDSFAALAEEYTEDTGSAENGGLYEAVAPGDMVQEFNDWIFDPARKPGDTGIVETSYGYHIMYFVGTNMESWMADIKDTLKNQKLSDYMDALLETVPVKDIRADLAYLKETEAETESASETGTETAAASETESETEKAK